MRQAGVEGRVVVRFVVDTLGSVEPGSVTVVSATFSHFESSAREAVATCRYRPARMNHRPVRVLVQAPIEFRLARR
jgi:TonB family protein